MTSVECDSEKKRLASLSPWPEVKAGKMYVRGGMLHMDRLQTTMLNNQRTDEDRAFLWMKCIDGELSEGIDWASPRCSAADVQAFKNSRCGHWLDQLAGKTVRHPRTGLRTAGTGAGAYSLRQYDMNARYSGKIQAYATLQAKLQDCHMRSFSAVGGGDAGGPDLFVAHDDLVSEAADRNAAESPVKAYFRDEDAKPSVIMMGSRHSGPSVRLYAETDAETQEIRQVHFFVRSPAVGKGLSVFAPPLIVDVPKEEALRELLAKHASGELVDADKDGEAAGGGSVKLKRLSGEDEATGIDFSLLPEDM